MVRIVLLRLLESYFRHRWLYVLPIVIAVVAGGLYVLSMPPKYSASGQIYVSQGNLLANLTSTNNSGSWWTSAAQSTVTEIDELLGTQAFVRTVIQKTDLEARMSEGPDVVNDTITYVRDMLSTQAVGDKLIEIRATGDDPNLVYQVVTSTMDAYVQWKINSGYQESIAARAFFDNLIAPYQSEVDKARGDLVSFMTAHPDPVRGDRPPAEQMEVDRLKQAVQSAEDRLTTARNNEESARLSQVQSESVTKQTYMVIDQPQIPQVAAVSTKTILTNMAIFLVVGIFLMVVGVAGGALIDRSLRFPIDVRHGLSLPVLAMVPLGHPRAFSVATADKAAPAPVAPTVADRVATDDGTQGDSSVLQPQT